MQFFSGLLNLFLQSNCSLCQRSTEKEFCEYCLRQLTKCKLSDSNLLWHQPLPVFAWGAYGGVLKRAIAVMKYEKQPQIALPLGQLLGQAWLSNSPQQKVVVVPIPLHKNKQKQRGYNQAALIAQSFCATTGLKLKLNGLLRVQETKAQFELSAVEREKNLLGAFGVGKGFSRGSNTPVLLIDDIYTTGATASSAQQTLERAGIEVLGLAVAAATIKNR
ncbi:ComF family protein [Iningainema tapete]|uniref:ComF family protein n=1 Tax=Iningainema tapete BLCC-T55 TaxID=2748662 RepID=A0A8J7C6A4_9CYAN|nr:ComF family protein [Iningainema tapete]MBD2771766.1 ComF family protein [Iningainema tapete BLCC-T55]